MYFRLLLFPHDHFLYGSYYTRSRNLTIDYVSTRFRNSVEGHDWRMKDAVETLFGNSKIETWLSAPFLINHQQNQNSSFHPSFNLIISTEGYYSCIAYGCRMGSIQWTSLIIFRQTMWTHCLVGTTRLQSISKRRDFVTRQNFPINMMHPHFR